MTQRPGSLLDRPDRADLAVPPQSDPLSEVLGTIRLTGVVFFTHEMSSPWRMIHVPEGVSLAPALAPGAQDVISYHVMTRGSCWAGLLDGEPVRVEAGDVLVFPQGDPYFMSNDGVAPLTAPDVDGTIAFLRGVAAGQLPFAIASGGGGPEGVGVVCGFLGCDRRPFNPLLSSLPRLLVVRRGDPSPEDRLERLISLTLAESEDRHPGGETVRVRLNELMFVEVIRRHLTTISPRQTGWLAGLRDEMVARSLALLHQEPGRPWTLLALARASGVSRSALADRFTRLIGEPPMQYLARWRMQIAARRLAGGFVKVSTVALEVGYRSEAAFSRAFKRMTGVAPASWRHRHE
jgi:AraC-like DNA-binding protein